MICAKDSPLSHIEHPDCIEINLPMLGWHNVPVCSNNQTQVDLIAMLHLDHLRMSIHLQCLQGRNYTRLIVLTRKDIISMHGPDYDAAKRERCVKRVEGNEQSASK